MYEKLQEPANTQNNTASPSQIRPFEAFQHTQDDKTENEEQKQTPRFASDGKSFEAKMLRVN